MCVCAKREKDTERKERVDNSERIAIEIGERKRERERKQLPSSE